LFKSGLPEKEKKKMETEKHALQHYIDAVLSDTPCISRLHLLCSLHEQLFHQLHHFPEDGFCIVACSLLKYAISLQARLPQFELWLLQHSRYINKDIRPVIMSLAKKALIRLFDQKQRTICKYMPRRDLPYSVSLQHCLAMGFGFQSQDELKIAAWQFTREDIGKLCWERAALKHEDEIFQERATKKVKTE
jgi:hypothetical protein